MTSETKEMIGKLNAIRWFENCGKNKTERYPHAKSKQDAISKLTSRAWSNFAIPITNRSRNQVFEREWDVDEYNAICIKVSTFGVSDVMSKVDPKISKFIGSETKIHEAIRLDIMNILWESEFSNYVTPIFYCPRIYPVYVAGLLPCGWDGEHLPEDWNGRNTEDLPAGRLRVY